MIDTDWTDLTAPSLGAIEALANAALECIPPPFDEGASNILLRVEDFAETGILKDMEIGDPFELTGLYDGIPMTEKSVMDQPERPDTIWLFRRAILDEWAGRGDIGLGDLVTHVVVHELAHHFGWSDDDIARIDRWWE